MPPETRPVPPEAVDELTPEPGEEPGRWAAGMRATRLAAGNDAFEVVCWYPADPGAVCTSIEYGGNPGTFRLGGVAPDAALAGGLAPRPLVLLAGAADSEPLDLGWLAVHLARRGNVAVAVAGDADPLVLAERVAAASDLPAAMPSLATAVDASLQVVAGFDLGGIAAMLLAGARLADGRHLADLATPRPSALALLNPCPVDALASLRCLVPSGLLHVIVSGADREAPAAGHGARIAASARGARLTRLAAPAGHHVFRGEPTQAGRRLRPLLAIDAAVVHRGSLHECTATLVDALVAECIARAAPPAAPRPASG